MNNKYYRSLFFCLLIVFLFSLNGCVRHMLLSKMRNSGKKSEAVDYVKDDLAIKQYRRLNGDYYTKNIVLKVVSADHEKMRKYTSTFNEYIQLSFKNDNAYIKTYGEIIGISRINFEGRKLNSGDSQYDTLEFTINDKKINNESEYTGRYPVLLSDKIFIKVPKGNIPLSFQLTSDNTPIGYLSKYESYSDWSVGLSNINIEENQNRLLSLVRQFQSRGFQCIGQKNLLINGYKPISINLSTGTFGKKIYIIYNEYNSKNLNFSTNNTLKKYGRYDFPAFISINGSNTEKIILDFSLNKNSNDLYVYSPPIPVKVLVFSSYLASGTTSPCDYVFRKGNRDPKWIGYLKIYLGTVVDNLQKKEFMKNNQYLLRYARLTKIELIKSGLKDLIPNITETENKYLSACLTNIMKLDLSGASLAVIKKKVHDEVFSKIDTPDNFFVNDFYEILFHVLYEKMQNKIIYGK